MTGVAVAIAAARADIGMPYRWGAKPPLSGKRQKQWKADCSGAVRRWVAIGLAALGVTHLVRDGKQIEIGSFNGSSHQLALCRQIPVTAARQQPGCLLFMHATDTHPGHVALVIGDDITIEATGSHGVCIVGHDQNLRRHWDVGAKLDELFGEVRS